MSPRAASVTTTARTVRVRRSGGCTPRPGTAGVGSTVTSGSWSAGRWNHRRTRHASRRRNWSNVKIGGGACTQALALACVAGRSKRPAQQRHRGRDGIGGRGLRRGARRSAAPPPHASPTPPAVLRRNKVGRDFSCFRYGHDCPYVASTKSFPTRLPRAEGSAPHNLPSAVIFRSSSATVLTAIRCLAAAIWL